MVFVWKLLSLVALFVWINVRAAAVAPATARRHGRRLRVCWNHRWEHDKNPKEFFDTLKFLHDKREDFEVVVLGAACISNCNGFPSFGWICMCHVFS